MGCNTSKEASVAQNEENKENEAENHVEESKDTKSASAKTITLRSNGTAKSPKDSGLDKDNVTAVAAAPDNQIVNGVDDSSGEEQAATKIQAAFRGHKIRKSMKQPAGQVNQHEEEEPTQEQLEQEFRSDDQELCHAATKIQASFRGHMSRKQQDKKPDEDSSSSQGKPRKSDEEELDIDLTDPDLNKAAVKIQASFRGHMVRKENEGETAAH